MNCHHLKGQIVALLSKEPGVFLQKEEKILGTGGGMRKALGFFGKDPAIIVNGDIFHSIDILSVVNSHHKSGAVATLVLHDHPRYNNVSVEENGLIHCFGDQAGHKKLLAFTGIHVIDPNMLSIIPEDSFSNIIDCYSYWIGKGAEIAGLNVENHFWTDMGTPQDYLDLHAALLTGQRCGSADPFFIGENVTMTDSTVLNDWVSLGSRSSIGSDVSLKRVVVWDGVKVADGTKISDAILV